MIEQHYFIDTLLMGAIRTLHTKIDLNNSTEFLLQNQQHYQTQQQFKYSGAIFVTFINCIIIMI